MNEMVKMVVVLTVLSVVSGGLLAFVHEGTAAKIENQQLQFVKGPAIKEIMKGSSNDPIADRFKIKEGDTEKSFFVGKFNGKADAVAFEAVGKGGFGGDVGLMVGVNIDDDKLLGTAVTTHSETPGLGARAKDDPTFVSQFKGLEAKGPMKVASDGGKINAMSGATVTSRAVCRGVSDALATYQKLKPEIKKELQKFNK